MPEATGQQKAEESNPSLESWAQVENLACELTVDISLPGFKVSDVFELGPQTVVNTLWRVGSDVPLRANAELIAYGEFEVVNNRLAVRLTELA